MKIDRVGGDLCPEKIVKKRIEGGCGTGGGIPQWIVPLHPEMQRRLELSGVRPYYFEVEARI